MLAALAGGAALMGRGKGMSGKETISDAQKAHNFASDAAVTGVIKPTANVGNTGADHRFDTKFSKPKEEIISKGVLARNLAAKAAKNKAMNYQRSQTFDARPRGIPTGNINQFSGAYKKGGRVTGIAKRGFGRALMKGKK